MLVGIVVLDLDELVPLYVPEDGRLEGETEQDHITRIADDVYPGRIDLLFLEDDQLPVGDPQDWELVGGVVTYVDPGRVDWGCLEDILRSVSSANKEILGVYYPMFKEGVRDKDHDYIVTTFVNMNGIADPIPQALKDNIEAALTSCGIVLP